MNPGPLFAEAEIIPIDDCEERSSTMFHPDILAALAKERRNTMLAEAAAARLARPARETRRHRRVPGSPEVRRAAGAAGLLGDVYASLVRRGSSTLEHEIALAASEELDRGRVALRPR
jgi:hypothetical protein